jgi:sodium/potassium/calcium exchanger 2
LDIITEKLGLSPDVAGATFMAAGGSAPEFFTAMATALSKPPSDVGISAIVGSAVFNVLFVIGACGLAAPGLLELTSYPLARDSSFYVVHLILLCTWFYDGKIEWWESLIQFSMYIIYCVFMAYSESVENWFKNEAQDLTDFDKLDTDHDGLITREEAQNDKQLLEQFDKLDIDGDGKLSMREAKVAFRNRRALRQQSTVKLGEEPEPDEPASLCPPAGERLTAKAAAYYVLSLPTVLVLVLTVPDVRRTGCWKSLYPVTFVLSIVWVAIFSWVMVFCAEVVGAWTEIDPRILGLTLIAAGTSVPDLLTSVIVTLNGHGDMAISSSIGSNIFDVTVGLPVPWLVYHAWYQGEAYPVESKPATVIAEVGSLIAMLVAVVLSIKCTGWILNKMLGGIMLVLYFVFLGVSIWQVMQEG